MNTPSVSVVVPVYNRGAELLRAVQSILRQSRIPEEIIVVDDGSDHAAWLPDLPPEVVLVKTSHRGRSASRNVGIRHSTGEYVAFLDSDDEWFPDKIERQLKLCSLRSDLDLVGGHVHVERPDGQSIPTGTASRQYLDSAAAEGLTFSGLLRYSGLFTSTVLVRRKALDARESFDESLDGNEDFDLWLRILVEGKGAIVSWPPLARYRTHSGNTAARLMAEGMMKMGSKHLSNDTLAASDRSVLHTRMATACRTLGHEPDARAHVGAALRADWRTAISVGGPRLYLGSITSRMRASMPRQSKPR